MAAIDLLLNWSPTSERMHQVVLAGLLQHTPLLRKLGIEGRPVDLETETQQRLFDLTVSLEAGQKVHIELKLDANLDFEQMRRQMAAVAEGTDILLYVLLGTAQFRRTAEEVEDIRKAQGKPPRKEAVKVIDLQTMLSALYSLSAEAPDPDRRDLAAAYVFLLRRLQDSYTAFEGRPLSDWAWADWFGFYNQLRTKLNLGSTIDYVPSPTGGFVGCWWGSSPLDVIRLAADEFVECTAYLQLEHHKLCFKISVDDREWASEMRNRFSQAVLQAAESAGFPARRPDRFGVGESMTVAVFNGDYRSKTADTLDWQYVSDVVAAAERTLRQAVQTYNPVGKRPTEISNT